MGLSEIDVDEFLTGQRREVKGVLRMPCSGLVFQKHTEIGLFWYAQIGFGKLNGEGLSRRKADAIAFAFESLAAQIKNGA